MPDNTTSSNDSKIKSLADKRVKKKQQAVYSDYIALAGELLGDMRRDVFSGDLMHYNESEKLYIPVLSDFVLGKLQSECRDRPEFAAAAVSDHLKKLNYSTKRELLVDFDRTNRPTTNHLETIANCLPCKNLSVTAVYEHLIGWGSKMFERLTDPSKQNRILIFKGSQGAGKDTLVNAMLGHLGQFIVPFTMVKDDADVCQQLISGLVMHISEFDRTNANEVSQLKNMITMPRAFFRGKYGRKFQFHKVRNSFIATCNVDNIIRDYTGNRRYLVFDLETILWNYPLKCSSEILSEWWFHYLDGFKVSAESEAEMDAYLELYTPSDPDDELCEMWEQEVAEIAYHMDNTWMINHDVKDVIREISKADGRGDRTIRSVLKKRRYSKNVGGNMRYFKTPQTD